MADQSVPARQFNTGIYEIVNTVNGKRYIGSSFNIDKRWYQHRYELAKKCHHSHYLQRSWERHGPDSFDFKVIESVEDAARLLEREQHYIDTLKPEYNSAPTAGNSLGVRWSDDSKRKKSEQTKEFFKNNPQARDRISHALKGKQGHNKGKPLSAEHRAKFIREAGWKHEPAAKEKISAASKNAWSDLAYREKVMQLTKYGFTPEVKAKLSEALVERWLDPAYREKVLASVNKPEAIEKNRAAAVGRWQNPEYRANVCYKLKGRVPHNKGKPQTDEQKAKQSAAMKRKYEDPEYRRKTSEATKAAMQKLPAEVTARIAAANIGKKQSAMTVAKRALANLGKVRTNEQRAAMSARMTAFYADKHTERTRSTPIQIRLDF